MSPRMHVQPIIWFAKNNSLLYNMEFILNIMLNADLSPVEDNRDVWHEGCGHEFKLPLWQFYVLFPQKGVAAVFK